MKATVFECANCGKKIRVPSERAGTRGRCPECRSAVTVPSASMPAHESVQTAVEALVSQAAVDAQNSAHFPSPPYCFYCRQTPPNLAIPKFFLNMEFRKTETLHRGSTIYKQTFTKLVPIPRCEKCALAHRATKWLGALVNVPITIMMGGPMLLFGVVWLKTNGDIMNRDLVPKWIVPGLILIFVAPLVSAIWAYIYRARKASAILGDAQAWSEFHGEQHPATADVKSEGYSSVYDPYGKLDLEFT